MNFLTRITKEEQIRILRFAFVGLSGVAVNLAMIHIFYENVFNDLDTDLKRNLSASVGWFVSVFTNFVVNDLWTWGDRIKGNWNRRLLKYYIGAGAGYFIQLGVMNLVVVAIGESYHLMANLAGIAIATIANYLIFHLWSFRDSGQTSADKAES